MRKKFEGKQPFVDNSKVSDHHAIIPTEQFVQLDHMTNEERRIYDLVVRRFLAVMYPPFEYEQTTIQIKIGTELFTVKGKIVKNLGWKEIYENETDEEEENEAETMTLPDLKKGSACPVSYTHLDVYKRQCRS